jgi:hydroxymethylglutaryl-CoA lyase
LNQKIHLVECPRDAMQGWPHFIDTEQKINYINALLKVGFHTIDFGSFVSPKAIPQMRDTREVLEKLDVGNGPEDTRLLAIVANMRGAEEAVYYEKISYLGFPFSISETFQQRNTNSSIADSFNVVDQIQQLCCKHNKELVIYISMGFGNPYGDAFNEDIVFEWTQKISRLGVSIISLADTVGLATTEQVESITRHVIQSLPDIEVGVHLHSSPKNWRDKLDAAVKAGCMRFDGSLRGIGGCPMAGNTLVGNMQTENMIEYFKEMNNDINLNINQLNMCSVMANRIFA